MHHQVLDAIMERLVQLPFVDAIYYDITNKWGRSSCARTYRVLRCKIPKNKKYPPFGGYFHFKFQIKCAEPAKEGLFQISHRTSGIHHPR